MKTIHYSHYHTRYDSFDWINKFVDPGFQNHLKLGKLWLTHAHIVATSAIIPFDLQPFVDRIRDNFKELRHEHEAFFKKNNVSFCHVEERLKALHVETKKFMETVEKLKTRLKNMKKRQENTQFHVVRAINDKIANLPKIFVLESDAGVLKLKNIANTFGSLRYTIKEAVVNDGSGKKLNDLRKEITLFTWCVDTAIRSLDVSNLDLKDDKR